MRVLACPVRYYYERNDGFCEPDRYLVCKKLSSHLGSLLDPEEIWNEVLAARPTIDSVLSEFLDTCIMSCAKNEWKPAKERDVRVISDKHGIAGIIDSIAADGTLSIISAVGAMPFGTYAADRLRIAAFALCLEEMTGREVTGGYVEYIPDGVVRFHSIQPRDRRQVISTLHKVRSIHNGEMPQYPFNTPCNRCKYQSRCESSNGYRMSELL